MPHQVPWRVQITDHPSSTRDEIDSEPDWKKLHGHNHRVGFKNRPDRLPGITHRNDERIDEAEEMGEKARAEYKKLKGSAERGDLVNFRDVIKGEKDLHLRHPENRSLGWRYVVQFTEDWVRNEEQWPAIIKKKQQEEEKEKEDQKKDGDRNRRRVSKTRKIQRTLKIRIKATKMKRNGSAKLTKMASTTMHTQTKLATIQGTQAMSPINTRRGLNSYENEDTHHKRQHPEAGAE